LNSAKTGAVLAGALTIEPSRTLRKILNRAIAAAVTAKRSAAFFTVFTHVHEMPRTNPNFVGSTLTLLLLINYERKDPGISPDSQERIG